MSFLSDYVLSQGTWTGAGHAAAMQLTTLAQAGYVHIKLQGKHEVLVIRTNKQDDNLSPEEQFLLRAVFGSHKTVILDRPHQKPVAQSAITVARVRLAKEGFIHSLSPRALQRRLFWGYFFVAATVAMLSGVVITPAMLVLVPCIALLVWIPYNVLIRRLLRTRSVFYKHKGRHTTISNARDMTQQQGTTPEMNIMAEALSQHYVAGKGYARADELWYEGLRSANEHAADFGGTVRENAISYDGFAGDSGSDGGDGGDGGDGSDGGGDGGGGGDG